MNKEKVIEVVGKCLYCQGKTYLFYNRQLEEVFDWICRSVCQESWEAKCEANYNFWKQYGKEINNAL
jgi:hypothetical protein